MSERTVGNLRMLVTPLPALDAIDLGNELVAYLAPGVALAVMGAPSGEMPPPIAIMDALHAASQGLVGKLGTLLPRLLAGTTVVAGVAGGEKYDLSKGREEVNRFLAAHPQALHTVVAFTAEAQFARFFPASVLDAVRTRMRSLSAGFNPSTSGTGSSTG